MDITHVSLAHFRSFAEVDALELPAGALLVAAAPNATGKTNFLESLLLLLRGRSWRGATEECVQWGAPGFTVRGIVRTTDGTDQLGVQYTVAGKKLRIEVNGEPASPVTFYTRYPVLLFLPEDAFIFTRGPEQRRNFLNQVLLSSSPYLASLVQYQRILRQRNAALKRARSAADIQGWTDLLIAHATVLWQYRRSLVAMIDSQLSEVYEELSGERCLFQAQLLAPAQSDDISQLLTEAFPSEQRYGFTLVGPHRDDIAITTDNRPIRAALSRGQLRSLTIALKLIAHRLLQKITSEKPLLLLDDVFSELDATRQQILLAHLPATQTILTCTTVPNTLQRRSNVHLLDLRTILNPSRTLDRPVPQERAVAQPVTGRVVVRP